MKIEEVKTAADMVLWLVESGIDAKAAVEFTNCALALGTKPKKAAKTTAKAMRTWPDDLVMDEAHMAYAKDRGFSTLESRQMWERFKDRNISLGKTYADWNAAWRTWVNNQVVYRNKDANKPATVSPRLDRRV